MNGSIRRWSSIAIITCLLIAFSAHTAAVSSSIQNIGTDGRTDALPYLVDMTGEYDIIPLVTTEDEMPLLEGTFRNYTTSTTQTIAMSGIPDGLGFVETNDAYYVFMNHELSASNSSQLSTTISGTIQGARVSIVQFTKDWQVVGAKNLIEHVVTNATTYTLNLETGFYENDLDETFALSRFCSGYLADAGFVGLDAAPAPVWFGPEEYGAGLAWAVYPDGTAVSIDMLGRYAKEQVYPPLSYRHTSSDTTVLLSTEDFGDGEIYMYVDQQTPEDPNGFEGGDLYVLRVEDVQGMVFEYETLTEGVELVAAWTSVSDTIALSDADTLSDWVNAEGRSTNFRRPEDIHEDPNNPNTFYWVTTGRNEVPPGATEPDNAYGRMYRMTIDPTDPTADGSIEMILQGGPDTGVSYDNMVVDHHGNVLIQEDRTAGGEEIMDSQMRMAYVWSYDIVSDTIEPLFAANQAQVHPEAATEYGAWETSGIIEVLPNALPGKSSYMMTVQAHTLESTTQIQMGQLLIAVPLQHSIYLPYVAR